MEICIRPRMNWIRTSHWLVTRPKEVRQKSELPAEGRGLPKPTRTRRTQRGLSAAADTQLKNIHGRHGFEKKKKNRGFRRYASRRAGRPVHPVRIYPRVSATSAVPF